MKFDKGPLINGADGPRGTRQARVLAGPAVVVRSPLARGTRLQEAPAGSTRLVRPGSKGGWAGTGGPGACRPGPFAGWLSRRPQPAATTGAPGLGRGVWPAQRQEPSRGERHRLGTAWPEGFQPLAAAASLPEAALAFCLSLLARRLASSSRCRRRSSAASRSSSFFCW